MTDRIDPEPGGFPPVEFLDIPPMNEELNSPPAAWPNPLARLSERTRETLASSALGFIEGLVESHHGDVGDVRSIIDALDAESAFVEVRHDPAS
jgi:hypothetical protein